MKFVSICIFVFSFLFISHISHADEFHDKFISIALCSKNENCIEVSHKLHPSYFYTYSLQENSSGDISAYLMNNANKHTVDKIYFKKLTNNDSIQYTLNYSFNTKDEKIEKKYVLLIKNNGTYTIDIK